jgi:hypothetical protein
MLLLSSLNTWLLLVFNDVCVCVCFFKKEKKKSSYGEYMHRF